MSKPHPRNRRYYECDGCGKIILAGNGIIGRMARYLCTEWAHVHKNGRTCGVYRIAARPAAGAKETT